MISRLINMHLTNKRYTITFTSFSAFNTRLPYKINFHIRLACHLPPNHPHYRICFGETFKLGGFLRCCGCFARHLVNTEVKAPVGPNHPHGDHPCLDCKLQGHLHLPQTETFGKKNPQVKKTGIKSDRLTSWFMACVPADISLGFLLACRWWKWQNEPEILRTIGMLICSRCTAGFQTSMQCTASTIVLGWLQPLWRSITVMKFDHFPKKHKKCQHPQSEGA